MNRFICAAIVVIISTNLADGQDKCPNFKIAVVNKGVYDDSTLYYLNKIHDKNLTLEEWISDIDSKIISELDKSGYTNLEFFSPTLSPGTEPDLFFLWDLILWSVNKDNPNDEYADAYFKDGVLYHTNHIKAFKVSSQLEIASLCVPIRNFVLSRNSAVSTNITQVIMNLIHHDNWPMDRHIWQWESKHPVPAREPNMEIRYQKEFLSLLDEESRKTEIYIKVKNCHGQYVYEEFNGQPVYFLKEMERLEYKDDPGNRCQIGPDWGIFSTVFTSEDLGAIGEYKVKKGIEPSIEKTIYKTCGIGNNSLIEVEGEIKVLGLELQVEPDRNTINVGEKTSILIDLHELDPDGTEILSCEGKEVDVQVTGVVDGTISHESGMITLNEAGVAFIEYTAGEKDRYIQITATFTPPGFPETITGEASITVRKPEGDFNGIIMYQRQVHWEEEEKSTYSKISVAVDLVENASIIIAAHYLRTIADSEGASELFEAKPLSGNFSMTMKKITVITDKEGNWTKIVDTWQGDKMMKPDEGSNILLTIQPQKTYYILQTEIFFPPIEGTTETSSSDGANWTSEADPWVCNASFEFEGQTDGNSVDGNWSKPATGPIAVLPLSGFIQGATWNWSMSRRNK